MFSLNVSKFGESLPMVTPSQAFLIKEGVETRHSLSRTDKGIVQTTNLNPHRNFSRLVCGDKVVKTIVV